MKTIELNSDQIITLNDYPLYSDGVLIKYFDKCRQGQKLPFVPVIKKDIVKKYLNNKLLKELEKFEKENPLAEYFMLDGSHRTTALTLTDCKIAVIIYKKDADIAEAKKLVATNQILENDTFNHNLIENCEILDRHFNEKPYFMTTKQKTDKMIEDEILPQELKRSILGSVNK